jgi:hypothetical protein
MPKILHTVALSEVQNLKCEGEEQCYSLRDLSWMLSQVLQQGKKLTEWELDFVSKIQREIRQGDTYFSPKQVKMINKIYAEKTAL